MVNSVESIINTDFKDLKDKVVFCTYPEILTYEEVARLKKKVSQIDYPGISGKSSIFYKIIRYFKNFN